MTKPARPALHSTGSRWPKAASLLALVLVAGLVLAVPEAALAQAASSQLAEPLRPPQAQEPADPPVIRNFLVAGLVVVSIIGATVIPSKRGHQD